MIKRAGIVGFLIALSALLWIAAQQYPQPELDLAFRTLSALTLIYLIGKVVIEDLAVQRIKDAKTRYLFRKSTSILSIAVSLLIVLGIWVQDPSALFVAYGLIGAGVAVSLQDVFKNFVGGLLLFVSSPYRVGDRIEIADTYGDVIDIGLMYTRVLEIQGWVNGDQATGRITTIPNGRVLAGNLDNYTMDNTFIWDEITIPITYTSDWETAKDRFTEIVREETVDLATRARDEIETIRKKYYLSQRETEPKIFVELTDNWINLHIRYITDVRKRRHYHNTISQELLSAVEDSPDLTIASETVDIVGFPGKDDR